MGQAIRYQKIFKYRSFVVIAGFAAILASLSETAPELMRNGSTSGTRTCVRFIPRILKACQTRSGTEKGARY